MAPGPMKIAVIGAGFAGATFVSQLDALADHDVTVFEKSRGIGGRLACRRAGTASFNHGAQFITARSKSFQSFLAPHVEAGVLEDWRPKVVTLGPGGKPYKRSWYEPHYVAQPGMNEICKVLLEQANVVRERRVTRLSMYDGAWRLEDDNDTVLGDFDWVVSTTPAPQAVQLLGEAGGMLNSVALSSCFAMMLWLSEEVTWDAAVVKDSPITWMSTGPAVDGRYNLVVHTDSDWAETHLEEPLPEVARQLLDAFRQLVDVEVCDYQVHRWRYARTATPLDQPYWIEPELRLAACGDWCLGDRVEDAFSSASALSQRIHRTLKS